MPNETSRIQNPGKHEHIPTTVDGQQVCVSCKEVLIRPILTQEEFKAANGQPASMWLDAIKSLAPKPIDWMWLEVAERLGIPWPNYIDQLADRYDGEPPHTKTYWGI